MIWVVVANGFATFYWIFVDKSVIINGVHPAWGSGGMFLCAFVLYIHECGVKKKRKDKLLNKE